MLDSYLAGFFDGDGYVGIVKVQKRYYNLRLTLINTNVPFLEKVQLQYGGILQSKGIKLKSHHLGHYQLAFNGEEAKRMILILKKHSIIKLHQLEVALTFPIGVRGKKGDKIEQERIYQKLRELKVIKYEVSANTPWKN